MAMLVDRPVIQHTIECLVERGVKHVEFLLYDTAGQIESHFQTGKRWGARFSYHPISDPERPYEHLREVIDPDDDAPLLLLHGNRLQPARWAEDCPIHSGRSTCFCWKNNEESSTGSISWTGAAWIVASDLLELPLHESRDRFARAVVKHCIAQGNVSMVDEPLDGSSCIALLNAQRKILSGEFGELIRCAGKSAEGIWIQRNVYLHPAVQFTPPVFVGPNAQIERRVQLGPNVAIGDGCYINAGCQISDAILMPDSLVGEGLAIHHCILTGTDCTTWTTM